MKTEYECRILDVDVSSLKKKLEKIGAVKVDDKNMRRYTYTVDLEKHSWIRLRDDGKKITLTYKQIDSRDIDGTKELEFEIKDFERANEFIRLLGFKPNAYQENKRTTYTLKNVTIDIDSWPKIPTYVEIEADSEKEVLDVVHLLGYTKEDTTTMDVIQVYANYGLEMHSFKELKFD
jgi:adenylate cyclase class 2